MPPHTATAAWSMGPVSLVVNDLETVAAFYQRAVGLHLLSREGDTARLGAGGTVLLELRADRAARRRSPREAGLFHTAFLLPTRADLGRWLAHAIAARLPLDGASDHDVSEALYLADPEGNGIEIYADRPREHWQWSGDLVHMTTQSLDIAGLLAAGGTAPWAGFPAGAVVGHVHLQVGDLAAAEQFYAAIPGLAVTCRYPGGVFFGADRYHHHLAANVWNSRGAGPRQQPSTGLAELRIQLPPGGHAATLTDPWGTVIRLVAAGATTPDGRA